MYTTKDIFERLKKKNIILLSEFTGIKNPITCKCHCGKVFTIKAHHILYNTMSCGYGMYQYKKGKDNYKFKGVEQLSAHQWYTIKNNAKVRELEFTITMRDAWNKLEEQNSICPLTNRTINITDKTASLDRIDSNKDYTKDNIQWVHKVINVKLKRNIEEINLKLIAKEVYENHKGS